MLEIVEDRYGHGATLITSQTPVDRWYNLIGEPTLADTILDRIIHNARRMQVSGDSLRKQRTRKRSPLDPRQPLVERSIPSSGRSANPADINRNGRPTSIGTGGRHQSGCPAGIGRNTQCICAPSCGRCRPDARSLRPCR
jgi:hypothetical protein